MTCDSEHNMPSLNSIPRRVRTKDAAKHLGIAARTLEKIRITDSDGPPFYKIGRAVIYDLDECDEWLASKRRRSTSDSGPPEAA